MKTMNLNEYITEHQNIALDAINALRITECADRLADSLAEKLEQLGDIPQNPDPEEHPCDITDGDYKLTEGAAWFDTPNGFVVRVLDTDEGISVFVYDAAELMEGDTEPLGTCFAYLGDLITNREEVKA